MATARTKEVFCSLVKVGTLELQHKKEAHLHPWYKGLCVSGNMIMVVDYLECNVMLYRSNDGKLLATSCKLESPLDICLINDVEIGVILVNSKIEILSIHSTGYTGVIERVRTLYINTDFVVCHAAVKFMDNLLVSGERLDTICWCIVSLKDGHVNTIHQICKGYGMSYLTTKVNTIYISCQAGPFSHQTGLYAYDIQKPSKPKCFYTYNDLKLPSGITVDSRGFIFVCNESPPNIHHLTDRFEPVTIYCMEMTSRLNAIFWDQCHGQLYVTSQESNIITKYRPEYSNQHGVPIEILRMDDRSIQLFEEALKDGKETVYSIRVMVVGSQGVGKTTLIKRLLGEEVDISERHSTEGIDVFVNCCEVSLSTHEWTRHKKDSEQYYRLQRLARVLNEQQSSWDKVANEAEVLILPDEERSDRITSVTDKEPVITPPQGERTLNNHEVPYRRAPQQDFGPNLTQSETNMAMLKLLQENAYKLKQDTGKTSLLTMWDFAGQYAFYTTHQTFLTRRAIYLLVSDVSEELTDLVADECYFDSEGMMMCKVQELIEVWLNSIHSCAPSPEASIPPVILVGTHVDKISEKQSPAKGTELETQTMTSERVEFTQPTTLTHAATASNEKPSASTVFGAVKTWFRPWKNDLIVEKTPVSSMTGTHGIPAVDQPHSQMKERVDANTEKRYRHEICERYFIKIRSYLKNKPTRFHLVDEDFAIDNTVVDIKLEDLKRKIVQVASQQSYWGEEIPARWLLLEQELMRIKAVGVKQASYVQNYVEKRDSQLITGGGNIVLGLGTRARKMYTNAIIAVITTHTPSRHLFTLVQTVTTFVYRVNPFMSSVISRIAVENINKEGTVRIERNEELDLFLRFLHETGTIIYFSIEILRENIVLDPQWLIDALKSLINAQPDGINLHSTAGRDAFSTIAQKLFDFKEKGILTLELIDAVWTKKTNPELHANRDYILMIMEQLNIIAKPRSFSEMGEKVENYFLAPCMLRQKTPREVISPEHDSRLVSTSVLCWVFTGKFLPSPIFHRLLAACVARWPIAKKETSEILIFCGCCVFDLDLFHRLTLHVKNHVVFARITRVVFDEVKTPDAKLCTRVRRFITLNLSKITSYLGKNLQYELCIQHPPSQIVDDDGMIICSPVLMWFSDEGHDPDGPIMVEHMNYARLCLALVTVCGNAIREILLTHVPAPHTNIYQAILANKTNLTSRRQVRAALLNQGQSQVVFPDPHGQYVATVDQFDIPLLYILIRNISTVPPPLIGWGNVPLDHPRDRSVGASVERIRLYRNHIIGHSLDGKITQKDFEDYWNKIDTVLDDIDDALGRPVYRVQLERQKRQVISMYEAC